VSTISLLAKADSDEIAKIEPTRIDTKVRFINLLQKIKSFTEVAMLQLQKTTLGANYATYVR
jgi:hypothetical protein